MKRAQLGRSGTSVSAIGLGCMGMSECYGPADEAESLSTLARAAELGIDFLDTADSYGAGHNESLIGRFLRTRRERIVVATKFGFVQRADPKAAPIDNSPAHIRGACEASLRRLGVDAIDLYYCHRVDRTVPLEETIGAMADLVRAGKVRALGMSEVSAGLLRRAAAVHPIAALQSEYSLWTRDVESGVLPCCRELGISLVAFSPLGRGFLSGEIAGTADLADNDYRRALPRFQPGTADHNALLVRKLAAIAAPLGCSAAQLAIAWLRSRGPDVIPIPGTRRIRRLEENAAADDLALQPATLAELDAAFPPGAAAGARYDPDGMSLVDR
jgi:aryl-alcohol dehydrogenase-like predicted oxidoreductase